MFNFKLFSSIVKEFARALGKGYTYNVRKNLYVLFGILWGIPIPIVTIGIGLHYKNLTPSLANIISEIAINRVNLFFLLHPILFGIVFGAMGTVRDEKEKQRLEYDQLKENFLSMVSHELWSPLTTVQGYVSFLKEGRAGKVNDKQKEALEIVEEHSDHLNHLIGELVDISKIETGKFEVKLDCADLVNEQAKLINSLRKKAEEKNITLENKLPAKLPCISADKKRITQVLTNLLENAIKFTPEDGRICISAKEKDDEVEFSIEDNGIGIPDDKIGRIFDKFYQADSTNNRQYGGCGLGLAITKSIIELHKGQIWIESKVGKGSKFFFSLKKC